MVLRVPWLLLTSLALSRVPVSFQACALDDETAVIKAVSAADIVCTCTNTFTPLFDGRHLKAGAHVNAVGSFTPVSAAMYRPPPPPPPAPLLLH